MIELLSEMRELHEYNVQDVILGWHATLAKKGVILNVSVACEPLQAFPRFLDFVNFNMQQKVRTR